MLITIEGIDGSGKSTMAINLVEKLKARGIPTIHTREIGGTDVGEKIRDLVIYGEQDPLTDLLLVFAARMEHIKHKILPALEQGMVIVSDRFIDSTYVYQLQNPILRYNPFAIDLFNLLEKGVNELIKEYKTIYTEVSLETSKKRFMFVNELDKFERDEKLLGTVISSYKRRIDRDPNRFIILDCEKTLDELDLDLDDIVNNIINERKMQGIE